MACSRRLNIAGSTRLAITAAGVRAGLGAQPCEQLDRLGDRHLLGGGDDGDTGARRVVEDVEHPLGLVADQADLHEVGDHPRRTDLADDVAARLGVDDDQVVVLLAHLPAELADTEDLLDAGRRVGDEVERRRQRADAAEQRHPHEQPQVLAQRVLGVHRHREEVRRDLGRLELELADVERVGERALGVHLADERATAVPCGDVGERGCDRGLADAALAGDPEQVEVEQTWPTGGAQVQPPKPILRSPSAEPSSM